MVKNIVFDMGGVLIDYDSQRTLREHFPAEYHEILNKEVFKSNVWAMLDEGTARSDSLIPEVLPKIPAETRPLIAEMLDDFYPYMPPVPAMYDFVKHVKECGYGVYLLSNATPRVFDHIFDIPALTLMDGYFVSALYKTLKPRREIYGLFCNKFSFKPDECFFIDDVEANINGAREYGMKGFVFKNFNIPALTEALRAEGINI